METTKQNSGLKLLLVIGTAWLFDAADVALLSFIMPLIKSEWTLTDAQVGLVSSITTVGMMIGAVLFGYLADRFGKKNIIIITLLIFSISNLGLALTTDVNQFLLVRFITGIGLGGELPVATTIIADSFSGHKRSKMLILVDSFLGGRLDFRFSIGILIHAALWLASNCYRNLSDGIVYAGNSPSSTR